MPVETVCANIDGVTWVQSAHAAKGYVLTERASRAPAGCRVFPAAIGPLVTSLPSRVLGAVGPELAAWLSKVGGQSLRMYSERNDPRESGWWMFKTSQVRAALREILRVDPEARVALFILRLEPIDQTFGATPSLVIAALSGTRIAYVKTDAFARRPPDDTVELANVPVVEPQPLFYLGTHMTQWLETAGVPLFISRRRLAAVKRLPEAKARWALDSGGFTELSMYGRWTLSPRDYVADVRRFRDQVGRLDFAAPQDWMCEPEVIAKTGLSVEEHQLRTTMNFIELRSLAPELPIIPVLQGWGMWDYDRHLEQYAKAGVDLTREPLVGVGTVCRRQNSITVSMLMNMLASAGLRLHGFGFKVAGLKLCAPRLASADSLAWSFQARMNPPLEGHTHASCANCVEYALDWRERLLCGLQKR